MLDRLRAWLRAISTRQTNTPLADTATDVTTQDNTGLAHESEDPQPCPQTVVPYDEHLLERTRTQWQFGDWHSLIKLTEEDLQNHPERAKLSLLISIGHHQLGNSVKASQFIRLAQGWECDPQLIAQHLMSGTYNSLACAAALLGQEEHSQKYFEKVWVTASPDVDLLIKQARQLHQLNKIGFAKPY